MSNSKSKKGKEEKKNDLNQQQERKEEDSTQGECAYFRLARSAGGGVEPRQSNEKIE